MPKKNEILEWVEDPDQPEDQPGKIIIETSERHLENFTLQNSPVNNELIRNTFMNNLFRNDISGQIKMVPSEVTVRKQRGKAMSVYTLCSFMYADDMDYREINERGKNQITGYDRRVYNTIGTLWLENRRTLSLNEIYESMTGYVRRNPSSKQLQAIEKSLYKFAHIQMYLDMTEEVNANIIKDKMALKKAGILKNKDDKIQRATIEDAMLHFRVGTLVSEQGKVFKSIYLLEEPCLLTYNRLKGTLLSFPMSFIGLRNTNSTDRIISLQDYLIMRVVNYKNHKMREKKIMYETMYRDSGVGLPTTNKAFSRDRETIKRILDEWKEKGLIEGYSDLMSGRSYVGIQFYVKD